MATLNSVRVDANPLMRRFSKSPKMIEERGMGELLQELPIVSDDRATAILARMAKLKTWMTWFIMFPTEYKNAGRLDHWSRFKFSCFHSINKDKSLMIKMYIDEVLRNDVKDFELALGIE